MKTTVKRGTDRDAWGTSLQGYVRTTRRQLEEVFGPAIEHEGWDKVTTQWILRIGGGTIVTIYDYKEATPPAMDEEYDWHIGGGYGHGAVAAVKEFFPAAYAWR